MKAAMTTGEYPAAAAAARMRDIGNGPLSHVPESVFPLELSLLVVAPTACPAARTSAVAAAPAASKIRGESRIAISLLPYGNVTSGRLGDALLLQHLGQVLLTRSERDEGCRCAYNRPHAG